MVDNSNLQRLKSSTQVLNFTFTTQAVEIITFNYSDHTCLPARVLKMEGADLLLALFIKL